MSFISEISLFYIIPILIAAAALTWFFFVKDEKLKELPNLYRKLVYLLRFASLSLIGILLLGILFEYKDIRKEKPVVIAIYDNSLSLLNYKDSSTVKKQISDFMKQVQSLKGEKMDLVSYSIGQDFESLSKLTFNEGKSDLSKAFEQLFSDYYNRNVGAIVLISDGNYNEGPNPVYAAAKIPMTPVFTIGVGDTISKKDQLIRDVITNEIAFLKNKFPVEVDLEAYKIGKRSAQVSIYQNGKTVASKQVNYLNGEFDSEQLLFELEASQVGFQQYTVEVKAIDGEYTVKNNRRSFYVEVLDARNKIMLLYGAPHPDISALKSVLEQDENIEVVAQPIDKWNQQTKNTDLIIWHEPGIAFSDQVNQTIQKSSIPVLYFVGVNTSNNIAQKLGIGLSFSGSSEQDEVQAELAEGFEKFELSNGLKSEIEKYPPVNARFGQVKTGMQKDVLLGQKVAGISKKQPLMYFGSIDKRKFGVFLGDGIWRWKMANYLKYKNNDLFVELFQKSSQYLVLKENASSLRVTLPKRFLVNEAVSIKAEFYNDNLELITKPKIKFVLTDQNGKKSNYEFAVNGNMYFLPLGKLKAGTYSWIASTSFDGKKHMKSGNFVVENIEIEKLDTKANHALLKQISDNSKGVFYPLKDAQKVLKQLENREEITSISYEESSFDSLLDYIILLILIILLLGSEWFLKRWNGLY